MGTDPLKSWLIAMICVSLAACETQSQTASLQCGAGGALVGYALCKALGRPDGECARAAAVIGAGGAAVCYSYASNLERRRKELAGHENNINRRIQYVRGLNQDTEQLNKDLNGRVVALTRDTDTLVAQIRQQRVTQEQIAKARQARDSDVKQAELQVAKGREALTEIKTYRAQLKQPSADLDVAIAKQQQLYADAEQQVQLLAAQRARV